MKLKPAVYYIWLHMITYACLHIHSCSMHPSLNNREKGVNTGGINSNTKENIE